MKKNSKIQIHLECFSTCACSTTKPQNYTSKFLLFRLCFQVYSYRLLPQERIHTYLCVFKYLESCLHKENEEVEGKSNKFKFFKGD